MTAKPRPSWFLLIVFAALLVNQAQAHHNMTAVFDFNDRVTFTGTLTAVDWRNPHTYFTVEVKGANGAIETWQSEGPAPSFFRIRDVGKTDFEASIGKTVTVEVSRARAHPNLHPGERKSSLGLPPELLRLFLSH